MARNVMGGTESKYTVRCLHDRTTAANYFKAQQLAAAVVWRDGLVRRIRRMIP
jgi:hypothetical protein